MITEIIIHCTATPAGKDITAEAVREYHRSLGWQDIGYHYLIRLDGTVETGRHENMVGAHCKGHNSNSIGIAYAGGILPDGTPADTRTPAQKTSLRTLVRTLRSRYPSATVHGHNEFSSKPCPCFDVKKEFERL